jgi:hypothetical protein
MRRRLTVAQQFLALRSSQVCPGRGDLRHERLTWQFEARPSPLGRAYRARIEFGQFGTPEVFIDAPDLHLLAEGRRLPHVYSDHPPRLCLYLPGAFEWSRQDRIDQTIVPWTGLWLFFFEEWLWSNEWKGGGTHPGENRDLIARRGNRR